MEAQAWTAIGLLAATLVGAFFHLGNRIDALGSEVRAGFQAQSARIDALGSQMRAGFQAQSGRIDALGSEMRAGFQAQSARTDALAARVEKQGAQLADRIYELAVKLDDHLRRHAS